MTSDKCGKGQIQNSTSNPLLNPNPNPNPSKTKTRNRQPDNPTRQTNQTNPTRQTNQTNQPPTPRGSGHVGPWRVPWRDRRRPGPFRALSGLGFGFGVVFGPFDGREAIHVLQIPHEFYMCGGAVVPVAVGGCFHRAKLHVAFQELDLIDAVRLVRQVPQRSEQFVGFAHHLLCVCVFVCLLGMWLLVVSG